MDGSDDNTGRTNGVFFFFQGMLLKKTADYPWLSRLLQNVYVMKLLNLQVTRNNLAISWYLEANSSMTMGYRSRKGVQKPNPFWVTHPTKIFVSMVFCRHFRHWRFVLFTLLLIHSRKQSNRSNHSNHWHHPSFEQWHMDISRFCLHPKVELMLKKSSETCGDQNESVNLI